jgi:pyrroloquinoline quinone biosynthesis protein D
MNTSLLPSEAQRSPRLVPGIELHCIEPEREFVLDDGTRRVRLNTSAGAILARCDGTRAVEQLIAELEHLFQARDIAPDVLDFLASAREQGWID